VDNNNNTHLSKVNKKKNSGKQNEISSMKGLTNGDHSKNE
jgi:hypothetical protein